MNEDFASAAYLNFHPTPRIRSVCSSTRPSVTYSPFLLNFDNYLELPFFGIYLNYKNISGQVMMVEGAKPALVSIYDYYDTKDKWAFHIHMFSFKTLLTFHQLFRAEVLYTLEKEEEEEEYIYKEASTDDTYVSYEDYYTK